MRYELQYEYTIRECASELNMTYIMQMATVNERNIILTGTDDGVEEDSDYSILLIAVNNNGASHAPIILNMTKEGGMFKINYNNYHTIHDDEFKLYWQYPLELLQISQISLSIQQALPSCGSV